MTRAFVTTEAPQLQVRRPLDRLGVALCHLLQDLVPVLLALAGQSHARRAGRVRDNPRRIGCRYVAVWLLTHPGHAVSQAMSPILLAERVALGGLLLVFLRWVQLRPTFNGMRRRLRDTKPRQEHGKPWSHMRNEHGFRSTQTV